MSGARKVAVRNPLQVLRLAVLGSFLVLGGCATGGSRNPFAESANLRVYILRVESRNNFDVEIFINTSGRRELIGAVQRGGLEYFEFEYPDGRLLQLELENTLGDRYRIPPPPLSVGGRMDLLVASELRRSIFRY